MPSDRIPRVMRLVVTVAATFLGGSFTLGFLSSSVSERITEFRKKKYGRPCRTCKSIGYYKCKLCNGNGTIKWSSHNDPVFINPCVCPTCDGFNSCFLLLQGSKVSQLLGIWFSLMNRAGPFDSIFSDLTKMHIPVTKLDIDALDSVIVALRGFVKDSTRFVRRCHRPDVKEFAEVAARTATGILVMGFLAFKVKLIFIPINNIIVGAAA